MRALEVVAGPTLHTPGEPRVAAERAIPIDARTVSGRELLRIERPGGSTLRLAAKTYDGFAGGRPKFYSLACVFFRGAAGALARSKGVAIEGPELRRVGEALAALALEYEAACAAGVEPWAQPGSAWTAPAPAPEPAPSPAPGPGDDCPSCGAELPAHLDRCSGDLAASAPTAHRPRPRRAEPTVTVTAATVEAARELSARLQGEDLCAGGPYTSAPVIQITRLDYAACVALAARLEGEGFHVEVKGI